jgi:hypothetical protein
VENRVTSAVQIAKRRLASGKMTDPQDRTGPPRGAAATHKAKNAVQRSVTALLDELAPERALKRNEHLPAPVEQHRSPNGCVLQASDCAVSVSWFAEEAKESALGELHVIVWRGTVARRGATSNRKGATIATELILYPIEPPEREYLWRATNGARYDTAALAAKCLALLQEQVDLAK